jgi:RHS repeat-associated protein
MASAKFGPGYNLTLPQLISAIASSINAGSSGVTASVNGNVITLTATNIGANSNYQLSTAVTWDNHFTNPSFTATRSGPNLTGGSEATLGNTPLVTQYAYDALNNLLCAVQKGTDTTAFTTCAAASSTWRPRSFVYDSLSRLTSATNPESGNITYQYDPNGNVSSKIAPLPNVSSGTVATNYQYDVLNRLTGKTYNGMTMPTIQFVYDGTAPPTGCLSLTDSFPIGRRTSMCDGSGSTAWSHDKMGRVSAQSQNQTGGGINITAGVSYAYNLDGSVQLVTYPSSRTLSYSYSQGSNSAGRMISVSDSTGPINYVTQATYAPLDGLTSSLYGVATGFAGIATSNSYNNRMQPVVLSAANPSQTIFSLSYGYGSNPGRDNGNVQQIANGVRSDATASVAFTYDFLNRISQANTTTTGQNCWGETYAIDAWGNLIGISGVSNMTGCNTEGPTIAANTNNQITGWCYDGAGNLLDMGGCAPLAHSFVYDAEGQLQSPPVANSSTAIAYTYYYDGDGNRVQKCDANPCTGTGATGSLYWRGMGGEVLAESSRTGAMQEEYVYFNGQRVARRDVVTGKVHYYFSDHLGSARVIAAASNGAVEQQMDFYPYGGIAYTSGADPNHYKFTGKERDSESGLDNFGARYYGSSLGRFMQTDPIWVKADRMLDPQRLNLYSYVRNNPLTLTDPSGMDVTMRTCNGPTVSWCFAQVQNGLKKEDRSHVHLVKGDDKNGFKKGVYGISVDADYKGSPGNFSTLQKLANDHSGTANIDVLKSTDSFNVRVNLSYNAETGFGNLTTMSLNPGEPGYGNSFAGYTYFPPGQNSPQPFSADDDTDVVANISGGDLAATIHHELRHVLLGDFGRTGNNAKHGLPEVEKQTKEAEKEAIRNEEEQ